MSSRKRAELKSEACQMARENCTWRILQRGFSVLNAESATGWAPPVISWFINHYNPH